MDTKVINDKQQEFNGTVYYLCGKYFQKNGMRLHRTVWEYHNGKIPEGYHVHHIDGNKANNQISNLELLTFSEHISMHMKREEARQKSSERLNQIRPLASAWHKSEKGKAWHREHTKVSIGKKTLHTYKCDFCGKTFESYKKYPEGMNHFCHQNCKAKFRTRRIRNESKSG